MDRGGNGGALSFDVGDERKKLGFIQHTHCGNVEKREETHTAVDWTAGVDNEQGGPAKEVYRSIGTAANDIGHHRRIRGSYDPGR